MANTHITLTDLFTGIADAIRAKKNSTETIVADAFPAEIENLRTGFDYNNQNVTAIPDYAFYGCEDLNSVDCYNLTNIGTSAFENCTNLKSVILYEGVTSIGENAFKGCSDLTIYCMFDSKPEAWHETWNPDGCEVVWLLTETWDISATESDNVTARLYNDIYNEGYYSLVISGNGNMNDWSSYIYTPWYSSYLNNIKEIIILDGVTNIGANAFRDCSSLTSVTIGNSVTSVGNHAFLSCFNLQSDINYHNAKYLGSEQNPYLYLISPISNDITSCDVHEDTKYIGDNAFYNCTSLTSVTIGNSVTRIGVSAFRYCDSLTSITIPDSVTSIGNDAFGYCTSLIGVTIPNSVTCIFNQTFRCCSNLTSVTIGDSVTSIRDAAFALCTSLTDIYYLDTIAQWQSITFGTNWNSSTPDYIVHCTDGDIAKDGTITYH